MNAELSCEFTATPACDSAVPDLGDLLIAEFLFEPAVALPIGFCWIQAATAFDSVGPRVASPNLVIT